MRSTKLLLVAGMVAGGMLASAAPASAYCDPVILALTGRCTNACYIAGDAYDYADAKTGDKVVPDRQWYCLD